ncbi:MAG TPA: hydrogenase maturation protease [Flavobacteriaceae bacterium]|nr:hydrogenase maturation protease [Flavobacteriaceae bacterium]
MKKLDNTLIVGIGNNTRQDDGLGWCFIEALEKDGYEDEHLLCKYQMMVEDAEIIAEYDTVVFIDASKADVENGASIEEIFPSEQVNFSTHEVPPNQILNLSKTYYNKLPKAYLIAIQGYAWDFKIELSPTAQKNLEKALSIFKTKFNY